MQFLSQRIIPIGLSALPNGCQKPEKIQFIEKWRGSTFARSQAGK
jgi:hypothetical protein